MSGLITVIVPVYNAQAYLPDCLDSLLVQAFRRLEILVVDDGSTDASARVCEDYMRRDGRVRLIRKENGGVSSARNLGLEQAKGDYIAFVDADDWILPHMLQEQEQLLRSRNADMILDDYLETGEQDREAFRERIKAQEARKKNAARKGNTSRKEEASPEPGQPEAGEAACILTDAAGYVNDYLLQSGTRCWSILFRREAVGDVRFPEGLSIGEDLLFLARLAPRLKRVLVRGKKDYCYYQNEAGAMFSGFRPSYMDQITCWELAEKELSSFGGKARERVRLGRFQAALLVAGKLAETDIFGTCGTAAGQKIPEDEYKEYLRICYRAAAGAWKGLGRKGRGQLPVGCRVKGLLFLCVPPGYMRLYHIWKRKKRQGGR